MKIKNVTFFGYSGAQPGEELYRDAYDVAAAVSREGYVVINGGGPGVMRASTEGAHSVGGTAIGITFYPKDITFFEGNDPNNKVDELIEADNYLERTLKLLDYGDVYVVFSGGTGTISEFGMAWGLARLHFGHHKPLILFGGFWYPILEELGRHMRLRSDDLKVYKIVTEVDHVVPAIKEFEEELTKLEHDHKIKSPFRH
ncbi:MAG: LOG family protein [Candidatus Blackburnbacteria bacterium]|nr:LOG family protein [Candidatus Blackburnbacteria bacterium]